MLIDRFSQVVFLLLVFLGPLSFSGELNAQKDPLKEGNRAYEEDQFREALIYYNQIEKIEKSAPILFKRGVCYFEINQLDKAIGDFQRAWEYGYKNPDIDYYTGLIQHHKGNFKLAAEYYKKFLREIGSDDIRRPATIKLIRQCGKALDLSYQRPLAIIEKLPGGVNTAYDEIGLIESPTTEGKFYFTSNQPNTSSTLKASDYDVYWVTNSAGKWSEPKRMKYVINRRDHEILVGFTPMADGLYFYRGKDHHGDIFLNTGVGDNTRTKSMGLPHDFSTHNSDVFFFDNQVILYSAKGEHGYGGFDLYASVLNNGKWTTPKNLGPRINSAYDEISPYLSFDGSELYFSSNRDESIGGFDIFYSKYLYEADKWDRSVNLGIPINSPGDDTHFSLSYDGLTAMFSSDRKNAFGSKDMYIARFKEPRGTQGYDPEVLPFLDYKIADRNNMTSDNNLEEDLSTTLENVVPEPIESAIATTDNLSGPVELTYQPLYYTSGLDIINEKNEDEIEELVKMMLYNPSIEVQFNCHASEDGIVEYKLYSSLKVAERLEQYFVKKGITDDRIHITGLADNYPIAKTEKEGGDPRYTDKYNSRLEFKFSNYDTSRIQLKRGEPEIPDYTRDLKFELYETLIEDAITYRIQLAVVGQMYRGLALELFNDTIVEEDEETGLYAYSIGLYDNYADALKVKRDMDRLGITDANVFAYYNGRQISEDQYVYYVNEFPDLRNLMKYNE